MWPVTHVWITWKFSMFVSTVIINTTEAEHAAGSNCSKLVHDTGGQLREPEKNKTENNRKDELTYHGCSTGLKSGALAAHWLSYV